MNEHEPKRCTELEESYDPLADPYLRPCNAPLPCERHQQKVEVCQNCGQGPEHHAQRFVTDDDGVSYEAVPGCPRPGNGLYAPTPSPTEPQTEPERCACGHAGRDDIAHERIHSEWDWRTSAPTPTQTDEEAFREWNNTVATAEENAILEESGGILGTRGAWAKIGFLAGIAYARRKMPEWLKNYDVTVGPDPNDRGRKR